MTVKLEGCNLTFQVNPNGAGKHSDTVIYKKELERLSSKYKKDLFEKIWEMIKRWLINSAEKNHVMDLLEAYVNMKSISDNSDRFIAFIDLYKLALPECKKNFCVELSQDSCYAEIKNFPIGNCEIPWGGTAWAEYDPKQALAKALVESMKTSVDKKMSKAGKPNDAAQKKHLINPEWGDIFNQCKSDWQKNAMNLIGSIDSFPMVEDLIAKEDPHFALMGANKSHCRATLLENGVIFLDLEYETDVDKLLKSPKALKEHLDSIGSVKDKDNNPANLSPYCRFTAGFLLGKTERTGTDTLVCIRFDFDHSDKLPYKERSCKETGDISFPAQLARGFAYMGGGACPLV